MPVFSGWHWEPAREIDSATAKRAKYTFLGLAGLAVAVYLLLTVFPPSQQYERFYPPCPFNWLTGWHCAGCGTTRGVAAMLGGDLLGLWRNNPAAMIALPFVIYSGGDLLSKAFRSRTIPILKPPAGFLTVLVVLTIAYTVLRNYFPILAPLPVAP